MALGAMAAVLLMMSFFQSQMLFPTDAVPAAGPFPRGAQRMEIEAPGGVRETRSRLPSPAARSFTAAPWCTSWIRRPATRSTD